LLVDADGIGVASANVADFPARHRWAWINPYTQFACFRCHSTNSLALASISGIARAAGELLVCDCDSDGGLASITSVPL
jgi:hypothetical protein